MTRPTVSDAAGRLSRERYSKVSITLHWLIAAVIVANFSLGLYMHDLPNGDSSKFDLYQLHKSFGITVLALSVLRLAWRLMHPFPALPDHMSMPERILARATHVAFYGFMLLMPLSGWAMVSASPWNIPTVLYGMVPLPHLPFLADATDKAGLEHTFKEVHETIGTVGMVLLGLHVLGALKHHFIDHDDVLARMLPLVSPRARGGKTSP